MAQKEETVRDSQDDKADAPEIAHQSPVSGRHYLISKKASDHLANERTFLAWVRTGLSVMAFGFVVERFGLLLRELGLKLGNATAGSTVHYSKLLGITITLLGIILLIVALFNFLHVRRTIDEERYHPGFIFAVMLTSITTLIGILLAIYLFIST